MTYQETYKKWLNSPALSPEEKAELAAIAGDDKEIESRFFSQLDFGTAGLRRALIHISEPTRQDVLSRMPSSA